MERRVTWVASYPKSGNTWIRLFLEAYITGRKPDLQSTSRYSIGDRNARWYQAASTTPLPEMSDGGILMLRTAAMLNMLNEYAGDLVVKTHCARVTAYGTAQIPYAITKQALYIVRDPRDVAVSLAHHNDCTLDEAIDTLVGDGATKEYGVPQYLGSWGKHVDSWMKAPAGEPDGANYTVAVVRYEDMLAGDVELWSHIDEILTGGPTDENRVADAIVLTGFRRLQAREREEGFVDQRGRGLFFRSGQAKAWRDTLNAEQVARIQERLDAQMLENGYTPTWSKCRPS